MSEFKYKYFNLTCLVLSLILGLAILYLWRGDIRGMYKDKSEGIILLPMSISIGNNFLSGGEIPKEINLAVPFTSQAPEKNWEQPWQDACEEAVVLMLDAYYKDYNLSPLFAKDEILKMIAWQEDREWGRSIEIEKVAGLFEHYSSLKNKTKIIANPTIEQIKTFIAGGQPVLAMADGKVLPNPHFRNGGPEYHALIIKGFTEDSFITNDPGTQFGENFVYKYQDLMNAIHDWNGGDVKAGLPVVLVIE